MRLRAGASGFALKSRPLDELLAAIRVVAAGEALLAPSVTRRLIAHFSHRDRRPAEGRADIDLLTEREREVLALVAQGLSNTEITDRLHVSLPTVKTHVSRILSKLGARDRTQLVVIAYESGLVTTDLTAPQPRPPSSQRMTGVGLADDADSIPAPDDRRSSNPHDGFCA